MAEINWNEFGSDNFVKLESGEPKGLGAKNWRQVEKWDKKALEFDIFEENGEKVEKVWTVTAMTAIKGLKPIIQKAEMEGKTEVYFNVIKAGEGKQTVYTVKEAKKE